MLCQLLDTLTHIDSGTSLLVSPALQAEVLAVAADPELGEAVGAAAQALADKWQAQKLQPGGKTGQSLVLAAHQGSAAAAFAAGGRCVFGCTQGDNIGDIGDLQDNLKVKRQKFGDPVTAGANNRPGITKDGPQNTSHKAISKYRYILLSLAFVATLQS